MSRFLENSTSDYNYASIVRDPISITSDSDFVNQGFPGAGTESDPYRIEKFEITATGSTPAIRVENTNAFFVIQHCTIFADFIGIMVGNTASNTGTIINNTCQGLASDGGGIVIQAVGVHIDNNTCVAFIQGIHLNGASDCTIKNNIIENNYYQDINIRYSSSNTVFMNIIRNSSQHGLAIVGGTSSFNIVYNNTFIDNSQETEYNIDGERTGEIHSQAFDEGINNVWYEEETKTGNIWSDYNGRGEYEIDGPVGAVDTYPQKIKAQGTPMILWICVVALVSVVLRRRIFTKTETKKV